MWSPLSTRYLESGGIKTHSGKSLMDLHQSQWGCLVSAPVLDKTRGVVLFQLNWLYFFCILWSSHFFLCFKLLFSLIKPSGQSFYIFTLETTEPYSTADEIVSTYSNPPSPLFRVHRRQVSCGLTPVWETPFSDGRNMRDACVEKMTVFPSWNFLELNFLLEWLILIVFVNKSRSTWTCS